MLSVLGFASPFSEDCTVTALSEASGDMAATNVLDDDLTHVWRPSGLTSAVLRFDFASSRYLSLDSLFLAGHNLNSFNIPSLDGTISPLDSWEINASDDAGFDIYQIPASIQEATNLTVVDGLISHDTDAPATVGYVQTAAAALTRLRARFANPSTVSSLPVTTNAQSFYLSYSTSGTGTVNLTVRLKENGTLRATLATITGLALSSTPVTAMWSWTGSSLVGAIPEIELETTGTGTAKVKWLSVRWDASLLHDPPRHYASGLLTPPLSPTYRPLDRTILSDAHLLTSGVQEVARLFVKLNRNGSNVPAGVPEVGRIDGGLRLQFRMAKDTWSITPVDPSEVLEMRGGNERIHEARPYLMADVRTPIEPISTALAEKMAMERFAGIRRGLYWMFDDSRRDWAPYTWFFGRLTDLAPFGNIYKFFTHAFKVRQIR